MANINIEFDGKIYSVDEATLAPLASPLERALIQQLAGTGAVIRLGGTNYNVDANKLASARNVLTDHFGNVAGTDSKVTVNGTEYGLSKTKLQGATGKMNETLNGISEVDEPELPPSEGLEYTLNDDGGSYSVTGIGTCEDTDIVIPTTYKGLPVTIIDDSAFKNNDNLTSVTIGNSVTSIGESAFSSCDGLASITIPNSVTHIDFHALYRCLGLTEINFNGTIAEWMAVEKVEGWQDKTSVSYIQCTDGQATPY